LTGVDLAKELARRGLEIATPEVLAKLDAGAKAKAVVLVQDAFTSHYETRLVLDVVDLLSALGYRPFLAPYAPNGKALHVHGFLAAFQRVATSNAAGLRALAASGVELVGIDPSVTLTFRSEYREALGAQQVPEILLLQEWLAKREVGPRAVTGTVPLGSSRYRFLPHCTERALAASGVEDWKTVFTRFGLSLEVLASGCCGMAGTYGHEVKHQATSARIYDLSWRKHLETNAAETLVASGYSCRSQVKRMGGGRLLHPAQVLLATVKAQAR
jgi:(R)-2-hydroxyglutarate dehydrogenase